MKVKAQKKILDFIFAFLLLVLFSPIIIILLVIIFFITAQSPIIIQERRLSLTGKKIKMIKIRTLKGIEPECESINNSGQVLYRHDLKKYVPPFCGWLRKSGLDEITQLVNVLKGEMCIVGPRPFTIADLQIMKNKEPEVYQRREVIKSKPGITGYWQIFGDRNKGFENIVMLDEYYEKEKSIFLDLKLLFSTALIVMMAKHSDSIIDGKKAKVKRSLISIPIDHRVKRPFSFLVSNNDLT